MHIVYRLSVVFLALFLIAAKSHAQSIVGVIPPASDQISLGVFKNGWARVEQGNDVFFINTEGEKFRFQNPNDVTIGSYHAIEYEKGLEENPGLLPRNVILMERNGLRGILNPKGEVVIPAEYTHIDMQYSTFWTLYKNDKKSIYLPGGTVLPFFDDLGYLDGEHFDVKQDGGWHIYRKSDGRIITKNVYEAFDYCGGCGSAAPYLYAKKNGKWGVIDWEENVLVPFEYDHEHRSMRSDNWVASFSKNGQQVIVHIPTQQEFDPSGPDTELVSGMLVTRDGKYGAYNSAGQLAVPFEYDLIETPNQNYYLGYFGHYLVVEKDRKKGVVRSDGTLVVPAEYEKIMVYDDYFVATRDGHSVLLTGGDTEPLIQVEHGDITHVRDYFYSSGSGGLNIFRVKQQAYYGLYFADSGVFHEPEFYDISVLEDDYFEGGRVIVADNQGQKSLLNESGEPVLPFAVEEVAVFDRHEEPLLAVRVGGKWGLYDVHRKKEVVPPQFDRYFTVLANGTSRFIRATMEIEREPDRYVLYDTHGQQVVDAAFSAIDSIDDRRYLIRTDRPEATDYAIFDTESLTLEQLDYRYVGLSGSPRLLVVSDDQVQGKLYDVEGKKTLRRDYWIFIFSGVIADNGDGTLPDTSDNTWSLSHFSGGLARIDSRDGAGYIDENEDVVVKPKYERVQLVGDHAIVNETSDFGDWQPAYFTDKSGNRLFPAGYYVDDDFFYNVDDYALEDIAILAKEEEDPNRYFGTTRYLALGDLKTGRMLTDAVYRQIIPLYNVPYMIVAQNIPVGNNGDGTTVLKYGLATKRGETLLEPQFDDIYYDDTTLRGDNRATSDIFPLLVREGDKWRYVNADGSYLDIEGNLAYR